MIAPVRRAIATAEAVGQMPKRAPAERLRQNGVAELGRGLVDLGYEVISTGGTLASLEAAGLPVTAVSDVTAFPEILDGRVKTLHPRIHGGLLLVAMTPRTERARSAPDLPIDVVAANLYPFAERSLAHESLRDALEQIDIGGPAMIRAAAKNFPGVVVLTDPVTTPRRWTICGVGRPDARRRALAAKAFAHTAAYDAVVAEYLRDPQEWPQEVVAAGWRGLCAMVRTRNNEPRPTELRAGELEQGVEAEQLAGKELSFNNLLDADAAWNAVGGLTQPAVAIVKHTILAGLPSEVTWQRRSTRPCAAIRFRPSAASSHSIARSTARQPNAWPIFFEAWLRRDSTTRHSRSWGKRKSCACCACPHPRHRLRRH